MLIYLFAALAGLFLVAFDQLSKLYIVSNFSLGESAKFIDGILDIRYIHNRGAAWGMLSGHTWILVCLTFLVMLICVYFLFKIGAKNKLLFWGLILILSGGLGNMIDRIFKDGNVVDFLHFVFWPQFPVFNVADCAVVVGAGLFLLYFILDTVKEYRNKAASNSCEEGINNAKD